MVTCPDCGEEFRCLVDENPDEGEEYGTWAECPECGTQFDPDNA